MGRSSVPELKYGGSYKREQLPSMGESVEFTGVIKGSTKSCLLQVSSICGSTSCCRLIFSYLSDVIYINFIEIEEVDKGLAVYDDTVHPEPRPLRRKKATAINESAAEDKFQQLK